MSGCERRGLRLEQGGDRRDIRRGRRGSKEAREILRQVRRRRRLAGEGGLRRVDDLTEERRVVRLVIQRVGAEIRSRGPPGNRSHADRVEAHIVAAGAGVIRPPGAAELVRHSELPGELLGERLEFHVSGVGTRLHDDHERIRARIRDRHRFERLVRREVVARA